MPAEGQFREPREIKPLPGETQAGREEEGLEPVGEGSAAEGSFLRERVSVFKIPEPPLPTDLRQPESAEGPPTLQQTMQKEGTREEEAQRQIQDAKISPSQLEFLLARIFQARTRKPGDPEQKEL